MGARHGCMMTNFSKSFNSVIKGTRLLPISSLLLKIFYNCVHYFVNSRNEVKKTIDNGIVYTKYASNMIDK